ncbi:DUF2600 family protein [Geomicrobium sp. JCM 19037]|uniref:DUF2600 family protein n=1 Tax=Geomicrobium sp. JCM 19037 TaxID=1460634 RepID=UPI000AD52D0C|nr:DUF2600 family protein [Geomicrobium sp. JCM 19037]
MNFHVPTKPWSILYRTYRETIPEVHQQLESWKRLADEIPEQELRNQAVWTIDDKDFHCEGGSVLALLAGGNKEAFIRFLCAYQTICDYLDTLCDKNDSQDPDDFRALHDALLDALTPGEPTKDYYRVRGGHDDGGYLHELVKECQQTLKTFPGYPAMKSAMKELAQYYVDFQVYKHVPEDEREGYSLPSMKNMPRSIRSCVGMSSHVAPLRRSLFIVWLPMQLQSRAPSKKQRN